MKGKSSLFQNFINKSVFHFKLDIQLFAQKRVSDLGISIQNNVSNRRLKNLIGELYREGAQVGDGSAMAAASLQVKTGELVGGKGHIIKVKERIANLNRILAHENLSDSDRRYAEKLLDDMKRSLKGEY